MQQKHGTHFAIIFGVLILALYMIFPQPQKLFDPNLKFWEKTNLKPGIDMVGGTSLTYEIRTEGTQVDPNLSQKVVEALKKRVDPDGVRNLVWRPQGATRIEIQMPLSDLSGKGKDIKANYVKAREALEATNVRPAEVVNAIETLKGDARDEKLKQLAGGSDKRMELYGALRGKYDQIQAAKEKGDLDTAAKASIEYEDLQQQLESHNLAAQQLEAILSQKGEAREKRLAEIKQANAGFDARLKAIDEFVTAFDAYNPVRDTLDDSADLKRLLRGSGVLEFHILVDQRKVDAESINRMVERLHERGPAVQAGDRFRWYAYDRNQDGEAALKQMQVADPRGAIPVVARYHDKYYALAWITPENSMVHREGAEEWKLESAYPTSDAMGGRVVGFRFDIAGGRLFSKLTRQENHGQLLGAMLDDKIISAANINDTIGRQGQISRGDGYTNAELEYLINTLNAGGMTAQLASEPISERTVGPQLGAANLKEGLIACFMGLVIVGVFLCGYYYLAGFVSFIAVCMNVVIVLGVMAMFNATFTLPGVAGIVLSIGAAVDANVLIFERLREEQQRGLSLKLALQHAYDRAFSAILDSNMTTMITSVILYWLGSEEVKGFGITLLIGLIASLFTALFVTKSIFAFMVDKWGVRNLGSLPLSFPKWDAMLKPHVNWMRWAPLAITASAIVIVVGLIATVLQARAGRLMDIEFAAGTAVQFELKEPMPADEVRDILARRTEELPALSVVSIGEENKIYEVVTPNDNSAQVRDAIMTALEGKLDIVQPSNFAGSDLLIDQAIGNTVLPIKPGMEIDGFKPENLISYREGAAIVLRNLNPKLTPEEIKRRIYNQRMSPVSGQGDQVYTDFEVQSPAGQAPTDMAVVLVAPGNFPYDQDMDKWRDSLAVVNWNIIKDALTRPPTLQKVSNIQPSVASDTQTKAVGALVLSVLVIMAYIWLRFGNLKYGTATVVAMLHDTLFVVGAIGVSHYLARTGLGHLLLIEEGFRVNMTLVAAILTVMSFSMLDTIVVFDRIRENRGKYGHLSRRVVNDSINQTMSRTLLTAGTTVVTLFGMYIMGGPAIHGFTFVLLVGILVGTYSSVAVAAPLLMLGSAREEEEVTLPSQAQASSLSKAQG